MSNVLQKSRKSLFRSCRFNLFTFHAAIVECSEETELGLHSIDPPISYVLLEPLRDQCCFNSTISLVFLSISNTLSSTRSLSKLR